VIGSGLIGLLAVQILKASISGPVIALDTDPSRRETASAFGADYVFDSNDSDLGKKTGEITGGRGVDHALEAVGATAPIKTAISLVRKGGSVTLIGNISPTVEIPLQAVVTRQISLNGTCAIGGEYPIALDLMARKKINVKPLISAAAPLSEGNLWINKLYNREGNLLKVVLNP
jgi:(R,R)-butanediol dehydrogenase/meso-butanediol dehydrogenase/diacetyl reductase/L-iditol 2-dehydrogenase